METSVDKRLLRLERIIVLQKMGMDDSISLADQLIATVARDLAERPLKPEAEAES